LLMIVNAWLPRTYEHAKGSVSDLPANSYVRPFVCSRLRVLFGGGLSHSFTLCYGVTRWHEHLCLQHLTDSKVVDKGASNTSKQWCDDWNPEVVTVNSKALAAAHNSDPQARAKIASEIDGISGVES